MAKASVGAIRIIDSSGDPCDNDSGALKVVLSASDDINIGNVVLQNDAVTDIYAALASNDTTVLDQQLLLGTHALLNARKDASTTIGITALDGTHNALHVAISDGTNTLSISQQSESVVDYGIGIMGEAKIVDGGALPNAVGEGEAVRLASTRNGILYTNLTDTGGAHSAIEIDASTQEATPAMVNVGGEYRLGDTTYTSGDATILQSDVNGYLKISGCHIDDGGFTLGTDRGIMMMGFAGTQSVDSDDAAALACTTGGHLKVNHGITGMAQGVVNVGTGAMQLDGGTDGYDVACKRVDFQAGLANTDVIWLGDSGVLANSLGGGIRLSPGDFYSIDIDNLTHIWTEAGSAGQKLMFIYYT